VQTEKAKTVKQENTVDKIESAEQIDMQTNYNESNIAAVFTAMTDKWLLYVNCVSFF